MKIKTKLKNLTFSGKVNIKVISSSKYWLGHICCFVQVQVKFMNFDELNQFEKYNLVGQGHIKVKVMLT